jgi:alpha-beta hydrolase superfamily lysophospholipase
VEHFEGKLKGKGSYDLYWQAWQPEKKPRAILLAVHGLGEHSGRYAEFARWFTERGYTIYAPDHYGHGKSGGRRCYIPRFADYVDDLKAFFDVVRAKHTDLPLFMIGHSMGGTIAAAFTAKYPDALRGLVLSGALLKPGDSVSHGQILLARLLSVILPGMGIAPIEAAAISKDKNVVERYVTDPLVYRGKLCARTGAELIVTMKDVLPRIFPDIRLPLLIMYGAEDRLSNPQGSEALYAAAGSRDKTLKRYDGLFHEIFNEPEREQVFADLLAWLEKHPAAG